MVLGPSLRSAQVLSLAASSTQEDQRKEESLSADKPQSTHSRSGNSASSKVQCVFVLQPRCTINDDARARTQIKSKPFSCALCGVYRLCELHPQWCSVACVFLLHSCNGLCDSAPLCYVLYLDTRKLSTMPASVSVQRNRLGNSPEAHNLLPASLSGPSACLRRSQRSNHALS